MALDLRATKVSFPQFQRSWQERLMTLSKISITIMSFVSVDPDLALTEELVPAAFALVPRLVGGREGDLNSP